MSVKSISWAFDQTGIGPTNKLILVALADHADDEGICWPGVKKLEAKTGLRKSAIYQGLRDLRDAGLLRKVIHEGNERMQLTVSTIPPHGKGVSDTEKDSVERNALIENRQEPSKNHPPNPPGVVTLIFEFWKRTFHKKDGTKLDRKRRRKIEARLEEGFSEDDLKAAILGAKADPFLMGKNEGSKKYDDLITILRDAPQVERLVDQAPGRSNGKRKPKKTEADWIKQSEAAGLSPDEAKEEAQWQMSKQ